MRPAPPAPSRLAGVFSCPDIAMSPNVLEKLRSRAAALNAPIAAASARPAAAAPSTARTWSTPARQLTTQ
ncbi:hypothetical protein GCM10010983_52050 [Caulobacter rhizosphaerae]|nr:hypothetical protein GCM10010983_52050 [Caulobacter rhizosphaerae]